MMVALGAVGILEITMETRRYDEDMEKVAENLDGLLETINCLVFEEIS